MTTAKIRVCLEPVSVALRWLVLVLLAAALGSIVAGAALAKSYRHGDIVVFEGVVTDNQSLPVGSLRVVLEASRRRLTWRRLKRQEEGLVRWSTLTDDRGFYQFRWEWHDYYNSFRLRVVAGAGRPRPNENLKTFEIVELGGSPVVTSLAIADAVFIREHRRFVSSISSGDQRRIYEEMGKPDRVERMRRAGGEEISWWYFDSGQVVRFQDGSLAHIEAFHPVQPF